MVLVDTSVWTRFLSNRAPYAAELDRQLERCEVARHDLVYGELLIGDPGGRDQFLEAYQLLHSAAVVPHAEVVGFVQTHGLFGRGIGWTDAHLLASCFVAEMPLWTADGRLAGLAGELGAAYSWRGL